jgi:hypothetical protein
MELPRVPEKLENVTNDIRHFNGLMAIWNKGGFKGKVPLDVLDTLYKLHQNIEQTLKPFGRIG